VQTILRGRNLTASRGGTLLLGVIAAAVAAVLLVVYLRSYRDSVNSTAAPATVLIAKRLIVRGTPGSLIAKRSLYQPTTVAKDEVKVGAIVDPALLNGRVAIADVYPGAQLTVNDFTAEVSGALNTQLTGAERAITLSIDPTHGSLANVASGDRIDIYTQVKDPSGALRLKLFRPNMLVLQAPGAAGGNVVLRVSTKDAADVLYAANNTTLYFAIRPSTGARPSAPAVADLNSVVARSTSR
jgi:Flp pilus assembly protein CpaB